MANSPVTTSHHSQTRKTDYKKFKQKHFMICSIKSLPEIDKNAYSVIFLKSVLLYPLDNLNDGINFSFLETILE